MINRALPGFGIQKLTSLAEDRIGLSPKNPLALPGRGESLLGSRTINAKILREPINVSLGDLNPFVNRTTVRGALRAVVVAGLDFLGDRPLD